MKKETTHGREEWQPTDLTYNGHCSHCGGCCGSILPLTSQELSIMMAYARSHGFEPKLPDGADIAYMKCPFLQLPSAVPEMPSCAIYDARPAVCRTFSCSNTNDQNAKAYTSLTGLEDAPKPINVWKAFDRTGIRLGGKEVTPKNAGFVVLKAENGEKCRITMGDPICIELNSGEFLKWTMCISISHEALQVFDSDSGSIREIKYDEIADAYS